MSGAAPHAAPRSGQPVEALAGTIERVTFHSTETGFCVLKVQARGKRDLVPVIGHAPAIGAGEWITATGIWHTDRQHGLQFKADTLKVMPPTGVEGMGRGSLAACHTRLYAGPVGHPEADGRRRLNPGHSPSARAPRAASRIAATSSGRCSVKASAVSASSHVVHSPGVVRRTGIALGCTGPTTSLAGQVRNANSQCSAVSRSGFSAFVPARPSMVARRRRRRTGPVFVEGKPHTDARMRGGMRLGSVWTGNIGGGSVPRTRASDPKPQLRRWGRPIVPARSIPEGGRHGKPCFRPTPRNPRIVTTPCLAPQQAFEKTD